MDQLLLPSEGRLRREHSGTFLVPVRTRSTSSGDIATEASSNNLDELEEQLSNSRRITLCKQVLLEATTKFNAAPVIDSPVLKSPACRNSGALLPLLNMLAAESDTARMVRCLDTLGFLLLDKCNRRACLELRALDVLLDILRRATDPHVLHSALDALSCLCKHDAKDKMSLWQHPNKGALLSMLSNRHCSSIIVETLRTCRTLCFAPGPQHPHPQQEQQQHEQGPAAQSSYCSSSSSSSNNSNQEARSCGTGACCGTSSACGEGASRHCKHPGGPHHPHHNSTAGRQPQDDHSGGPQQPQHGHHRAHGSLQLLEPALLTVASELLHPASDATVLLTVLKLLHTASAVVVTGGAAGGQQGAGCCSCSCWHNAVFRIVPLLTHCADVDVVESALSVLVNLSEHDIFHNMFFASGCIPPLLHLLSHKRCSVSQSASCVLSALAEGGLSRDKLCQDTALLAMMRVLQTNTCVVVTLGVLYMLGRLAAYRSQVVRSLKSWGAVPLLLRLLATTSDEDASESCRQLLRTLGVQPPPLLQPVKAGAAGGADAAADAAVPKATLHAAYSSIVVFGAPTLQPQMPINGVASGNAGLCRTISAAATVAAECAAIAAEEAQSGKTGRMAAADDAKVSAPFLKTPAVTAMAASGQQQQQQQLLRSTHLSRFNTQHSSFRFFGGPMGPMCGPVGPIAAAVPPAAAY